MIDTRRIACHYDTPLKVFHKSRWRSSAQRVFGRDIQTSSVSSNGLPESLENNNIISEPYWARPFLRCREVEIASRPNIEDVERNSFRYFAHPDTSETELVDESKYVNIYSLIYKIRMPRLSYNGGGTELLGNKETQWRQWDSFHELISMATLWECIKAWKSPSYLSALYVTLGAGSIRRPDYESYRIL